MLQLSTIFQRAHFVITYVRGENEACLMQVMEELTHTRTIILCSARELCGQTVDQRHTPDLSRVSAMRRQQRASLGSPSTDGPRNSKKHSTAEP